MEAVTPQPPATGRYPSCPPLSRRGSTAARSHATCCHIPDRLLAGAGTRRRLSAELAGVVRLPLPRPFARNTKWRANDACSGPRNAHTAAAGHTRLLPVARGPQLRAAGAHRRRRVAAAVCRPRPLKSCRFQSQLLVCRLATKGGRKCRIVSTRCRCTHAALPTRCTLVPLDRLSVYRTRHSTQ